MAVTITTLVIVQSLLAIANADTVTFSKIFDHIYVATDSAHFALYGPIKDKDGIRAVAVNGQTRYYQTPKCETDWNSLDEVKMDYNLNKEQFSKIQNKCPAITNKPTNSYTWSDTLSNASQEYSAVKIDDDTLVYSSAYFPSKLAKVIFSGDLVFFVHYNGFIALKLKGCLYINERILINGIDKMVKSANGLSLFSSPDKVFKKYLKSKRFDENKFKSEQEYCKTYTKKDFEAIEDKIRGSAFVWSEGWKS